MATIHPAASPPLSPLHAGGAERQLPDARPRVIASWIFTVDHKRIGVMYLCCDHLRVLPRRRRSSRCCCARSCGRPAGTIVDAGHLQPVLHAARRDHGVPGHHARASPRRWATSSCQCMLGSEGRGLPEAQPDGAFTSTSWARCFLITDRCIGTGGLDTGWTFYAPYSTTTPTRTSSPAAMAGTFVLGFSSIFTGLNFLVTIHKLRPPGMTWFTACRCSSGRSVRDGRHPGAGDPRAGDHAAAS